MECVEEIQVLQIQMFEKFVEVPQMEEVVRQLFLEAFPNLSFFLAFNFLEAFLELSACLRSSRW